MVPKMKVPRLCLPLIIMNSPNSRVKPARLRNYAVTVKEWNDEIIFVRQVTPGASERSFGIQVARLAGLPDGVVGRAKEILAGLEQGDGPTDSTPENLSDSEIALEKTSIPEPSKKRRAPPRLDSSQLELF